MVEQLSPQGWPQLEGRKRRTLLSVFFCAPDCPEMPALQYHESVLSLFHARPPFMIVCFPSSRLVVSIGRRRRDKRSLHHQA